MKYIGILLTVAIIVYASLNMVKRSGKARKISSKATPQVHRQTTVAEMKTTLAKLETPTAKPARMRISWQKF